MRIRSARGRGFTLIEVLVALIIAALLLPALLMSFGNQADGIAYLRDKSIAQWVASNKLEEARLEARHTGTVFAGKRDGMTEMAQREWHWWLVSEKTEVEDFYRLQVKVAAREQDEDAPLYTLVGFTATVVAAGPGGGVGGDNQGGAGADSETSSGTSTTGGGSGG